MTHLDLTSAVAAEHTRDLTQASNRSRLANLATCCRPSSWSRAAHQAVESASRLRTAVTQRRSRSIGTCCTSAWRAVPRRSSRCGSSRRPRTIRFSTSKRNSDLATSNSSRIGRSCTRVRPTRTPKIRRNAATCCGSGSRRTRSLGRTNSFERAPRNAAI